MRVVQPEGRRGSLKWIQRAVEARWNELELPIIAKLPGATEIDWRSPRRDDDFAEYRDSAFLEQLGLGSLAPELASFWPTRGPQWDALAVTNARQVLLIEAKAHVAEFCTPASQASTRSRERIQASLTMVAEALGSRRGAWWPDLFYQLANRLAHLWFLRSLDVDAYLVLVGFVGDRDVGGPETADAWSAAYDVATYALGLPRSHPLARRIIHVCPKVADE